MDNEYYLSVWRDENQETISKEQICNFQECGPQSNFVRAESNEIIESDCNIFYELSGRT